ncbi:hypothetical protein [Mesorhizobium sp. B2-2-3]|nr:hypothetical protein [Mesorhizobium sp. B2-2-3]
MVASREKESLAKVLAHEGGYVNHPRIAKRSGFQYYSEHGKPV